MDFFPDGLIDNKSAIECGAVITQSIFSQIFTKDTYAKARPVGRGMGCLLWIQHLIDILPQFM